MVELSPPTHLRIDLWLDVSCVCKTRSEAKRACKGGKVSVNGNRAKPHQNIQPGDRITLTTPGGRKRQLVVKELSEQHVPKPVAKNLYQDVTPLPTPEELNRQEFLRMTGPVAGSRQGAPPRSERRLRRRLKSR